MPSPTESVEVIGRAEALASQGRWAEAIALLEGDGGGDRAAVEIRLLELRYEATSEPYSGQSDAPRDVDDPFPDVRGLVTVDASDTDTDLIVGAVRHHGHLRVDGLIDEATCADLRAGIDRSLLAFEQRTQPGHRGKTHDWARATPRPGAESVVAARGYAGEIGSVLGVDCPNLLARAIEIYRSAGVLDVLQAWFGRPGCISGSKCNFRRVDPNPSGGWHQDAQYFAGHPALNIWIALSDCGGDSSSLDLIPRRQTEIYSEPGVAIAPDVLDRLFLEEPPISPRFRAGDAIWFDAYLPHQTGIGPGHTQSRYNFECWFLDPLDVPAESLPLNI